MRAGTVVEGVVGGNRAIQVDSVDLPARAVEVLGNAGVEVFASREVQLAVVAEHDGATVMFGVGIYRVLVENNLTARHGARVGRIGREPR